MVEDGGDGEGKRDLWTHMKWKYGDRVAYTDDKRSHNATEYTVCRIVAYVLF